MPKQTHADLVAEVVAELRRLHPSSPILRFFEPQPAAEPTPGYADLALADIDDGYDPYNTAARRLGDAIVAKAVRR